MHLFFGEVLDYFLLLQLTTCDNRSIIVFNAVLFRCLRNGALRFPPPIDSIVSGSQNFALIMTYKLNDFMHVYGNF